MKDDQDFNIHFVGLIESHPCVYDYTCAEYSKKREQDRAWAAISEQVSETVEDCKERWKNLRGCYTRHLKILNRSSGTLRVKKPYYLADYLQFLQPFTKTRKSLGTSNATAESVVLAPEVSYLMEDSTALRKEEPEPEPDIPPKILRELLEISSLRAPVYKKLKSSTKQEHGEARNGPNTEEKADDPDVAFFHSILPDMREMNGDQKRRFKVGILNLAGQILSETPALSTLSSSSTCTMHS